ncbi:UPF0125 protein yfjF [uncultured Candidatus Thioglobus sp.]|nr:UPF0125 protein yfjF [uncultured Candidatus Thioglobus sp.]
MKRDGCIPIEVAYADAKKNWLISLLVEPGCTVEQGIEFSGILVQCPTIDLAINKVGVFSKIVDLDTLVTAGDRIEIYRPLIIEPKHARRLRAKKK